MKNKVFLYVIVALLVVSVGVFIGYQIYHQGSKPENLNAEPSIKNNDNYKIVYNDNGIPDNAYTIIIDKDYNINVTKKTECSSKECLDGTSKPKDETYNINLKTENKEKLKAYLPKLFPDNKKEIEMDKQAADSKELEIIRSIIYNSEELLDIALEEYDYQISYSYGYNTSYYIFIKNNNITVKKVVYNHLDEISEYKSTKINFSAANMTKIIDKLKTEFKTGTKETTINKPYGDTLTILQSIINNNELELNELGTKKLLFTISRGCSTAHIYDDNSYIVYYKTGRSKNDYISKTSTFNMQEFIANLKDYTTTTSYIQVIYNNTTYYLNESISAVTDLTNSITNFGACLAVD